MPNIRQDEKAAAMYEQYRAGHSLEQVAAAFGVTRQSVYKMFVRRDYALRERAAPLAFVTFNGERYTLRKNGYYGKTRGDRSYLHQDIWVHHHGPIPDGYDIHHKDDDRGNNRLSNLECLPKAEHTRRYSPFNNQHTRGRRRG